MSFESFLLWGLLLHFDFPLALFIFTIVILKTFLPEYI